jgi:hypothetical protein
MTQAADVSERAIGRVNDALSGDEVCENSAFRGADLRRPVE